MELTPNYRILALSGPGGTGKTTFINSIDYGPSIKIPSPSRQIVSSQSEIKSFHDQHEFTLKWFDLFEASLDEAIKSSCQACDDESEGLLILCDRWFIDPVMYLEMWLDATNKLNHIHTEILEETMLEALRRQDKYRHYLMYASNPPFTTVEDGFRKDAIQNYSLLRDLYMGHIGYTAEIDLRFACPEKVLSFVFESNQ
jgi:predicted ATPase